MKKWKKTKRQRKRLFKSIIWKIKLEPETRILLKTLSLKWSMSEEKTLIKVLKWAVKRDWKEYSERLKDKQG